MNSENKTISSGQWMALVAAILGWLFDGFEMGLFPLVMTSALKDLLSGSLPETLSAEEKLKVLELAISFLKS